MVATTLSQSILQGMDPSTYRNIADIENGQEYLKTGMDSSPTTKWGAVGRLANALAGSYIQNQSISDLGKSVAAGKKQSLDDILSAVSQKPVSTIPSAPPAMATPTPALQPNVPQAQAPVTPDPGSPNAQVAARFPANMSPGTAASPLPNDAQSPLDTAQYPAGPVGGPSQVADAGPVAAINDAMQPRGIRNNNALNIEDGPFAKSQAGYAGSDGRFAKFQTPEHGVAAAGSLLDSYSKNHGLNTVAGIVNRWAPPTDGNNTMAYASDVAGKLGIDPNAPVPPELRPQLIAAMAQHENGKAAPGTVAASGAPVQVASATPTTMNDADAEAPAAKGTQVAQAGNLDVHKLMAVLQNPYADETTKQLAQKLLLNQLTPSEDTYGVTGESPFGGKKYGFINTKDHTINGQPADGGTASKGPLENIDSSKTGEDYLKQFPPEIQSGVRDYIEGRRMPTGNPRVTDIVRQVASKYGADINTPADDASFGARHIMLNDLQKSTPGSIGGQITSLRTASNHLANMAKDAESLGNYDTGIAPLSAAVNNIRGLGTEQAAKMQALQDDAQHYGQEITKFYSGSPGGEAERDRFMTAVNGAKSPKELAAVIQSERSLIPGRGEELQNRITTTLGPQLAQKYAVHSPESLDALKRVDQSVSRMRGEKPASDSSPSATTAAPDRSAVEAEMRRRGLIK